MRSALAQAVALPRPRQGHVASRAHSTPRRGPAWGKWPEERTAPQAAREPRHNSRTECHGNNSGHVRFASLAECGKVHSHMVKHAPTPTVALEPTTSRLRALRSELGRLVRDTVDVPEARAVVVPNYSSNTAACHLPLDGAMGPFWAGDSKFGPFESFEPPGCLKRPKRLKRSSAPVDPELLDVAFSARSDEIDVVRLDRKRKWSRVSRLNPDLCVSKNSPNI